MMESNINHENPFMMMWFGLTLEGKALSWLQNLEPSSFIDFNTLEKDFILAFTKMGIKHNVVALIYILSRKIMKL